MQKNKGFTLIELLVVVGIIALLASVILIFVTDASSRTQKTAFKEEVNNYQKKAIIDCTGSISGINLPTNTPNTNWDDHFVGNNCSNNNVKFRINASAVRVKNCTAVVNELGVTYSDTCK